MIFLIIMLIVLILIGLVRYSNNKDLINHNCQDELTLANVNNAKKVLRKSKTYNVLFIIAAISLIIILICNFTDLDDALIDYISIELYQPKAFDYNLYFIPLYTIVIREILIQVRIGEFLLKYFKVKETELDIANEVINPLMKNLLTKMKK